MQFHWQHRGAVLHGQGEPDHRIWRPGGKTYGDADFSVSDGQFRQQPPSRSGNCTVSGPRCHHGCGKLHHHRASGGDGNYNAAPDVAQASASSGAVTVTADTGQTVTARPIRLHTYSITSGNLVSGDSFSGALIRAAGESVGPYAINQGTLALSSNYTLTYVAANFTITAKAITVTADAGQTKVYGAADPAPYTYSITSGGPLVGGDSFTGLLTRVARGVGSYAINQGTLALSRLHPHLCRGQLHHQPEDGDTVDPANDKTYDGTNTAGGVAQWHQGRPDDVACTSSAVTFASSNAVEARNGNGDRHNAMGNTAGNYTLSVTTATTTATIPEAGDTVDRGERQDLRWDQPAEVCTVATKALVSDEVACTSSAVRSRHRARCDAQTVTATGIPDGRGGGQLCAQRDGDDDGEDQREGARLPQPPRGDLR